MAHLQISLQTEIEFVGTLFLIGRRDAGFETFVHFICQCPFEAPLARYFGSWSLDNDEKNLGSKIQEVNSTDGEATFILFNIKVEGELTNRQYLEATARELLTKLRHTEEVELSSQELDDQLDWANTNYGSTYPMPNFSRPRH